MLFNKQGIIDIDEMVASKPSFQNIMADGIVTEDELCVQSQRVLDLLHEAEHRFSDEDLQFIKELLAETNVLSAIYNFHKLQNPDYYGNL